MQLKLDGWNQFVTIMEFKLSTWKTPDQSLKILLNKTFSSICEGHQLQPCLNVLFRPTSINWGRQRRFPLDIFMLLLPASSEGHRLLWWFCAEVQQMLYSMGVNASVISFQWREQPPARRLPSTTDSEMRLLVPAITDLLVRIVWISFLKFTEANIGTALS